MSIYDDPDLVVSNEYIKFEEVGTEVTGDVISVGKHTWENGDKCIKLVIRDDDGTDRTLTAGQMKLAEKLKELRPDAGDRIRIKFTEIEKRPGGKTMKHFDVDVKAGGAKGTASSAPDESAF